MAKKIVALGETIGLMYPDGTIYDVTIEGTYTQGAIVVELPAQPQRPQGTIVPIQQAPTPTHIPDHFFTD